MKPNQKPLLRVSAPLRVLAQRFAYLGLVALSFMAMMIGKADTVMVEALRGVVTDAVTPILNLISRPAATVADIVNQARELTALRLENERLREDNARLLQWQASARHLDIENRELRGLLRYAPGSEIRFVTARVVADAGGAFAHSLLMMAGERDGLRKGQAVMTGEGLVGRVQNLGTRSSRVLLVTDLNSRIPVITESSRTRAILAGNNSARPRLIHQPQGSVIVPGERIVTSGHGGGFPPGLPIGVVEAVGGDGLLAVRLFVDRDKIDYVRAVDFGLGGIIKAPDKPAPSAKDAEPPAPAE